MNGTIGIEKIKDKILADARELCDKILEDARREAQSIIGNAEKEAFQKVTIMTENAKEEALLIKKRIAAVSELENKKKALKNRQDMVEEAFSMALDRISSLPNDKYRKFFEDMLVNSAEEGEGVLVINKKDKERFGASFAGEINQKLNQLGKKSKIVVAQEELNSKGGFILRYGDMEINCTLEVILNIARPAIESEVAGILFGENR
ncbi:MAG: hypothetical protein GXX10_09810 [Clostridiaceae bacterium]|nr:hypothetical protein [Clostridiaceae bacterium]